MYTPHVPLLYSKTWVYRGTPIFLIFAQKHRLWVLVRTASPIAHNLCFEQTLENYLNFSTENFFNFHNLKICIMTCFRHVTGLSFGQNCTIDEACLTFLATCINKKCGCTFDRQYVPHQDACIIGKY